MLKTLKGLKERCGKVKIMRVNSIDVVMFADQFLRWIARFEQKALDLKCYSVFCYLKIFDDVVDISLEMILNFYFRESFQRPPVKEELYKISYDNDEETEEDLEFTGTLQEIKEFVATQNDILILEIFDSTNF